MWLPRQDRNRSFRGLAAAVLVAGMALGLSACGFTPLYGGVDSQAKSPVDHMAAIRISPLPDRIGQQMHNLLRDRLNPIGQPREPVYSLSLRLSESRRELGIREDETATRANLSVSVQFTLSSTESGGVLYRGNINSVSSYNILTSPVATGFGETDARKRALRELADGIRTRLGIYFSRTQVGGS